MLLWSLTREDGQYGYPKRSLKGHSHFVQDVVISSDGQFALTGSWDHTLRLWDLHTGQTTRRFIGHTKDVLSVAFSMDNRQACTSSYKSCSMHAASVYAHYCVGIGHQDLGHRIRAMVPLSSCGHYVCAAKS